MSKELGNNIGKLTHVSRRLTVAITEPLFRTNRKDEFNGLSNAADILKKGKGLVIFFNHFSLKDPPHMVREIFVQKEMRNKRIVAPLAHHMYKDSYGIIGNILGVVVKPIVNENTLKKAKYKELELGNGTKEYIDESINALKQGGIVLLPPQGTREESLGQPKQRIVGNFMARANRNGLTKFGILFIGIGIEGTNDYSQGVTRGFNLRRKYSVHIGSCLTNQDLMQKANGSYKAVDNIVFEELGKVVPPSYK